MKQRDVTSGNSQDRVGLDQVGTKWLLGKARQLGQGRMDCMEMHLLGLALRVYSLTVVGQFEILKS